MTNIPQKSWKCWFHLVGIYIVTGITVASLESEFITYAKFRHEFLKQTKTHLRTVLVDGIPRKLRTPAVLRAYLDLLYPGDVVHIRLGINIKYLQRLVEEREDVVTKLERAMYQNYISHTRPKIKVGQMVHEVDAIIYYTQQLESYNKSIQAEQERVRAATGLDDNSSHRHSTSSLEEFLRVTEIKLKKPLTAQKKRSSDSSVDTNSSNSSQYHRSVKAKHGKRSNSVSNNRRIASSTDPVVLSEEVEEYQKLSYQFPQPISSPSTSEDEKVDPVVHSLRSAPTVFEYDAFADNDDDEDDSVDHADSNYTGRITVRQWLLRMWYAPTISECFSVFRQGRNPDETEVVLRQSSSGSSYHTGLKFAAREEDEDAEDTLDDHDETARLITSSQQDRRLFLSRAFVTFRTFTAATTAKQVIHMQLAGRLAMSEAPEPSDIAWINMYTTRRETSVRRYFVDAFIILLIVVWVAPVTLLSYVFSYDAVTKAIPVLATLSEKYNILESLIDLLQPIVLVALMNLLPPLLMALGVFEGSIALSVNQFRAFSRYFAFQIINVFLVNAIAGSVIDAITSIYDSPQTAFSLLGNSLPKMGGFFTNYILVKALTGLGMELVRLPAFFMSWGKMLFTHNVTPRDRQAIFYGGSLRNVTNPGWFPYHKIYAQDMLLFVICTTYSCVAPFTLLAGLCYFSLASVIYKHQMIYVYEPVYETGGKWWPIMARCMVVALLFAQGTLAGMFILKETYTQLYLLIVLFAITLTYYFYVASIYTPLANHLPLDMAISLDQQHQRRHENSKDAASKQKDTHHRRNKNSDPEMGFAIDDHGDDYLQPSLRAPFVDPLVEFPLTAVETKPSYM